MKTIFVNICSYRDKLLETTLNSLIKNESGRNNIVYGIFEQTSYEDSLEKNNPKIYHQKNIRYKRIDPQHSDGVVWARHINSLQVEDEEFYYQIDSHVLFDKDWDHYLILDYQRAKQISNNEKVVLTAGCLNFEMRENVLTKFTLDNPVTVAPKYYNFDENLKLWAHGVIISSPDDPEPSPHIFAGNFFTTRDWLIDVGYNTNIFFSGEEQMMALMSFLKGYDMFIQRKMMAYHLLNTENYNTKPTINSVIPREKLRKLEEKTKIEISKFLYSIDEQSLVQFKEKYGVDYINKKISPKVQLKPFLNQISREKNEISN